MLELKNITKDYPTGAEVVHALKGVSLSLRKSEFVSILGQSGCGKTTMLNIIGGLDKYTSGDLVINGTSTKFYKDRDWDAYRNHTVGFVFQSYNLIPHQTVIQNVELALALSGYSKHQRRAKAKKALEMVGLGDQLKKRPGEMSGGQMQRVAIARAIVNDPDIILADEPTGALDTETSLQVMEILKELSKERLVIMVTHNPELAEKYSTRIVRMLDGCITDDSSPMTPEEIAAEAAADEAAKTALTDEKGKKKKVKKPSLSPLTSFSLSLKNLFTKKGRTILTSFAGSIGIIGIALILSVSQGMTMYIDSVQESTLSAYPLTLEAKTVDLSSLLKSFMESGSGVEHGNDAVYKDPVIADMVNALADLETSTNDLKAFKSFLEAEMENKESPLHKAIHGIQYTYALTPTVYTKNADGKIIKSDIREIMSDMLGDFMIKAGLLDSEQLEGGLMGSSSMMPSSMMSTMGGMNLWQELLPGLEKGDPINNMLEEQYDVVYGSWPNSKDEVVLVLNEKNELDDLTLYAMGLLSEAELNAIIDAAANKETLPPDNSHWSYEEICNRSFKVIFPYNCYTESNGVFTDISSNENMLKMLYDDAMELRVSGIIRPNADADVTMLSGTICYTNMLTEHIIAEAASSDVVKAQLENPGLDVLTGLPFQSTTGTLTEEEKAAEFRSYVEGLDNKGKLEAFIKIQCYKTELAELEARVEMIMAGETFNNKETLIAQISAATAEQMGIDPAVIADKLSQLTLEELRDMVRSSIEDVVKDGIEDAIRAQVDMQDENIILGLFASELENYTTSECAAYYGVVVEFSKSSYDENLVIIGCLDINSPKSINLYASSFENKDIIVSAISDYNNSVDDTKKISYTDFLGIMMSSITTIINAITYVLIAFVSVSLVVSSIMIGVITLISVQERTKEIGILRSLGASKGNVSGMFNAETLIIGFTSGALGVIVTYLLILPINLILNSVTGINTLDAVLPFKYALALVAISMILTLFSGFIPSRSAAKKDPVVALRTE